MKITHILAAGAIALAGIGMASAQTVITITGSSAYRGSVHKAIIHILNGTVIAGSPTTATVPSAGGNGGFAYSDASDFTKANSATFRGYLGGDSAKEVIIKTSWTGSGAGIQTVASTDSLFTVRVLPAATVLATGGTAGLADATNTSNAADLVLPDIAMADNRQVATAFIGAPAVDGNNYTTLTATKVGVVPFQFVRSAGSLSGITNMTAQIARAMWTGTGKVPYSFFTGVASDSSTSVYSTGRDGDSGTRIGCFAETGIGISSGVQQYDCALEANVTAGVAKLYAAQTVNGIAYELGQGGEKSGGTLAGTSKMGKTSPALTKSYVGYMSTGDAATLVGNGGTTLTYNGVPYSLTALQEGTYTFWGYEYLLYKPSLAIPASPNTKLDTATALVNMIIGTDATVTLASMHATRSSEAGKVTQ